MIDKLVNSPGRQAQINEAKNRFIRHPDLQARMGSVWQEFSQRSLAKLERPTTGPSGVRWVVAVNR